MSRPTSRAPEGVSRRDFLRTAAAVGAGLTVAAQLGGCRDADAAPPATTAPFAPDAWVRITPDDQVTVMIAHSEMGQGSSTGLAMLVAEELDADWSRVRIEAAPAHKAYHNPEMPGMQGTGGSTAVRARWQGLREAGAKARVMLVSAAAAQWGVPAGECTTADGAVVHEKSGRRARYGELCTRAATMPVPETVALKPADARRIIGTSPARLDIPSKTDGTAVFGLDVQVPGLLVACVARCPVFGGRVKSFDAAKARAVPGVKQVVQIGSGVAVVATDFWSANRGRNALTVTWDEGELAALDSAAVSRRFRELAAADEAATARKEGEGRAALARGSTRVNAEYEVPYLAHATMEPMNCTARITADGVDVWAPTQFQDGSKLVGGGTRGLAAKIAGVGPEQVRVHTTQLGGGFGRRFELDFVAEAVELAKAVGAPVKVVWTREDDTRHDFYRPAAYGKLEAALGADGLPVAWTHRVVSPSIMSRFIPSWVPDAIAHLGGPLKGGVDGSSVEGVAEIPYAIPNIEVDYVKADIGVPVGFWRSVGHSQNAFIAESFIDELAHAAGQDPYAYRRRLLAKHPRHLAVLERAATEAGWGTPLPEGRARGIAVHESFGSYVAQVAEVSVEGGAPRVHRVVCVVDCGTAVYPDQVKAQMEGAIVYGLTAALHGEITLEKGRVVQGNFDRYPMLRIDRMPVVEVHIIDSGQPLGGCGEPGTPPIAPAVCNALFALTGTRVRRLPIRL